MIVRPIGTETPLPKPNPRPSRSGRFPLVEGDPAEVLTLVLGSPEYNESEGVDTEPFLAGPAPRSCMREAVEGMLAQVRRGGVEALLMRVSGNITRLADEELGLDARYGAAAQLVLDLDELGDAVSG